jgi:hypothetical protein
MKINELASPETLRNVKEQYFSNSSLLDNDEHAAKRVSDAFDTPTELRDEELGGASSFGLARPSDVERNERPDRSAHMRITVRLLASLNHVELRQ